MAAKQISPTGVVTVAFAQIFWNKTHNERLDYGNTDTIRDSLAERGWYTGNPISVFPISTTVSESDKAAGRKSEVEVALEERQVRWDLLKKASTPESAIERTIFEVLFTESGKLIVPRYSGNAGFRRASVYELAMLKRFRNTELPEGDEKIPNQIPVVVKTYSDEAERIVDQQLENELQGVGTVKVPELNKLKIAMRLFRLGKREIYLRKLYKNTTGQKLHNTCEADMNWPNLNIYGRCFLPGDDANQIPFSRVRHDDLIKLNNRFDADDRRKKGQPLTEKQRSMEPVTTEDVAKYFNDLRTSGNGNAKAIMGKKDIEAVAKQNAVGFFQTACQAVIDNQINGMAYYVDHADQLNLHKQLIDTGNATVAGKALALADKHTGVLEAVVNAINKGVDPLSMVKAINAFTPTEEFVKVAS